MKNRRIISALILLMVFCLLFTACSKKDDVKRVALSIDDMLELANETNTFTELITRMFSDYVAYTDVDGSIKVVDRITELNPPEYDFSKMSTDKLGFKVYDADNPVKQSWKGIDVSHYQKDIDWEKVANSGVDYAIIRLGYRGYTEGKLIMDNNFEKNVKGALDNGIEVGVYFVTQAITAKEAEEEAAFVLNAIKKYDVKWPIVFDIEGNSDPAARANKNSSETNTKTVIAFCNAIKDAGKTPMIYANTRWLLTKMNLSELKDYDIWYAYYRDFVYFPYNYTMWQYSSSGSVDGIKGDVDLNISFKNYAKQ